RWLTTAGFVRHKPEPKMVTGRLPATTLTCGQTLVPTFTCKLKDTCRLNATLRVIGCLAQARVLGRSQRPSGEKASISTSLPPSMYQGQAEMLLSHLMQALPINCRTPERIAICVGGRRCHDAKGSRVRIGIRLCEVCANVDASWRIGNP